MGELQLRLGADLAGRYEILGEVGAGGMAVVYAARDVRHRRSVALKVLHPELTAALSAKRFLQEIQVCAGLRHPNIVPLFDSGESEGVPWFVMPLVEGETLRTRLGRGTPLGVEEALGLAVGMADALAYAHERGVVHRDVKPENILLERGQPVVTDFGVARALGEAGPARMTREGAAVGTPSYMSPEQISGEGEVDGRADQYGLACVLYEMLVGQPPFTGGTVERLYAQHLMETPPPVTSARPAVPALVASAIARALSKSPGDRFPTTADFARALAVEVAVQVDRRSVAVLPFLNLSSDPENEYFADGITEDVIAQLSRIRALKVVSRSSVIPFRERKHSSREVAERLQVATLLDGSVRRSGTRVRIVAQLVDAASDEPIWAETYDRELTDIFAIQTEVALHIADALDAELSYDEQTRIRGRPTTDPRTYQLLLQGRHHLIRYTTTSLRRAVEYFEAALEQDPRCAPAWAGLGLAFCELGEQGMLSPDQAYPRAREAASRGLELDPALPDAHVTMAQVRMVYELDWAGAEAEYRRALELSPGAADAYDLYGRLCSGLGRHDEAIHFLTRALELDPLAHRNDVATAYLRAGRHDEALEVAGRSVEFAPEDPRARATLGWTYLQMGRREEGLKQLEEAVTLAPDSAGWRAQLGQAYALHGDPARAREVLEFLLDKRRDGYVSPYHLAYVYTGLGEHDRAVACLEQAFEQRAGAMYGVGGSFLFAPLRTHPGFQALLGKLKLAT